MCNWLKKFFSGKCACSCGCHCDHKDGDKKTTPADISGAADNQVDKTKKS